MNANQLVSAFAPTVPMWSVCYDEEARILMTEPVRAIAVMRGADGELFLQNLVCWDSGIFESPEELVNFLGYSDVEHPDPKSHWAHEIDMYLGRRERAALRCRTPQRPKGGGACV
jgi:hypothetical protein